MEAILNTETISTFYKRAIAFCDAKWKNGTPDRIEICDDGSFCATWTAYSRDYDDTNEYFTAEEITVDLDVVAKQREERLIAEKIENDKRQKEINARYDREQKEKRLIEYNKLKKEFEK